MSVHSVNRKNSGKQAVRRVRMPSRHVEGLDYLQQRRLDNMIRSIQAEQ